MEGDGHTLRPLEKNSAPALELLGCKRKKDERVKGECTC